LQNTAMMEQKQNAYKRMERVFPAINRTVHTAKLKEDWLTEVRCDELGPHDLQCCHQFADQMQHDLYKVMTKLHSLKLQLLHMQCTVLTGLFHIDETVVEAGKVAVEILAAKYMEASRAHQQATKEAKKQEDQEARARLVKEETLKAAEAEAELVAEEAAASEKKKKEDEKTRKKKEKVAKQREDEKAKREKELKSKLKEDEDKKELEEQERRLRSAAQEAQRKREEDEKQELILERMRQEQELMRWKEIKAEAEARKEKEREEQLRLEKEREEQLRLEQLHLEKEREEQLRLEKEREEQLCLEQEREEQLRLEKEREERLRLEQEREEQLRLAAVVAAEEQAKSSTLNSHQTIYNVNAAEWVPVKPRLQFGTFKPCTPIVCEAPSPQPQASSVAYTEAEQPQASPVAHTKAEQSAAVAPQATAGDAEQKCDAAPRPAVVAVTMPPVEASPSAEPPADVAGKGKAGGKAKARGAKPQVPEDVPSDAKCSPQNGSQEQNNDTSATAASNAQEENSELATQIFDMFGGEISFELVQTVLLKHKGDQNATVNALLDGSGPLETSTASATGSNLQPQKASQEVNSPLPSTSQERSPRRSGPSKNSSASGEGDDWNSVGQKKRNKREKKGSGSQDGGMSVDTMLKEMESNGLCKAADVDQAARQRLQELDAKAVQGVLEELKFQMEKKQFRPRNISAVVMKLINEQASKAPPPKSKGSKGRNTAGSPKSTAGSPKSVAPEGASSHNGGAEQAGLGQAGLGLKNEVGERNCFINVVIQSMWHLRAFRDGFLALPVDETSEQKPEHEGIASSQAYQALKRVFDAYQRAYEKADQEQKHCKSIKEGVTAEPELIDSSVLREAMSMRGAAINETEFQLGDFADAAEAHMTLLQLLEATPANALVQKVFAMPIRETRLPSNDGGEAPKPTEYSIFVHYVNAHSIFEACGAPECPKFDKLLSQILHAEENPAQLCLRSVPQVFTLGLVWRTANESVAYIKSVVDSVTEEVLLDNIFDTNKKGGRSPRGQKAEIRGMCCYYGKHFCALFRSGNNDSLWHVFDDSMVKEVGTWSDVQEKCYRGALQPCLLFYETKRGHR